MFVHILFRTLVPVLVPVLLLGGCSMPAGDEDPIPAPTEPPVEEVAPEAKVQTYVLQEALNDREGLHF